MKKPVAVTLLLVLALSLRWQSAAAQTREDREKARDHFLVGVELLDKTPPDYQRALAQFTNAYALYNNWQVLGNMGLCAHRLERDGEARDFYTSYLDRGGTDISQDEHRNIQRDLSSITSTLAAVQLSADVTQGDLVVVRAGSVVSGQIYALNNGEARLGLRAGAYRITLQANGLEQSWPVVLEPQDLAAHTFTLNSKEPGTINTLAKATGKDLDKTNAPAIISSSGATEAPPTRLPQSISDVPSDSPAVWSNTGYVLGGLGIAALGVGAYFGQQARTQESAAQGELLETCILQSGTFVCPGEPKQDFGPAHQAADRANALLIGGGILAAAGAALVIWSHTFSDEQVTSLRVQPSLHPHNLGAQLGGTF